MATCTAMSQSANDRPVVLIANPGSRRVELFQAALARQGAPPARVIAYADLLQGRLKLSEHIPAGAIVKIDSPGQNFEVETILMRMGDAPKRLESIPERVGQIRYPGEWFWGFSAAMSWIESELSMAPPHFLMNDVDSSVLMFNKTHCHWSLNNQGIPVTRFLHGTASLMGGYAHLIECMLAARMPRIFLKLASGSSGSGVVAFAMSGGRQQATTTVEMETIDGELCLFNSRKIRTYTDPEDIRRLIDALCFHNAYAEQWIPKAGIAGKTFDLRIVTLAGEPRFFVVRMSKHPITNLHLLNARGDIGAVRERLGPARWEEMLDTCRRVAALFPKCLYVAIDMLIRSDWKAHAVLEVNAFGDLLPGITDDAGDDLYTAQINACGVPA